MSRFLKILIIIVMIVSPAILFSQINSPVVDDVPDVEFNKAETIEKFKASVTIYGKGAANGEIILNAGASINPSCDSGRIYTFSDISRITVVKWSVQRKGSGWIFYPDRYEIVLKNKTVIQHDGNLGFLNRIRFARSEGRESTLFTYFYDYFRNGKWLNTGAAGEKTPPSKPAAGTLYIIELK